MAAKIYQMIYHPEIKHSTISIVQEPTLQYSESTPSVTKPTDKKTELMKSLEYLKSKKSPTKQDKDSIYTIEMVLKNMKWLNFIYPLYIFFSVFDYCNNHYNWKDKPKINHFLIISFLVLTLFTLKKYTPSGKFLKSISLSFTVSITWPFWLINSMYDFLLT